MNPPETSQDGLQARASLYRLFSAAFRDPSPEVAEPKEVGALLKAIPGSGAVPMPPRAPSDPAADMRRVFGYNLSPDCPPYETQYGRLGVFRQSQTMADLAGFYRAFGVDVAGGDRRPDHLPVELEFASLLCLKEARALEKRDSEGAGVCRGARARFLQEHLALWAPAFSQAVSRKAPGSYYAALSQSLEAFVRLDAESLGVVAAERLPGPRLEEPEDPCRSCFGGIDETV